MTLTAADLLVERLIDWNVEIVFGLPGDGINGVMEALRRKQEKIRFIQVRHEEAAAFMACGYAKFTGRLGVCLATSGPGGIHLLNGLYDAKLDGQPVLAITGLPYHDAIGTHTQQDVELDRLFSDVAGYSTRIMGPDHVEAVVDLACRSALYRRGVAHLTLPIDIQVAEAKRHLPDHAIPHERSSMDATGRSGCSEDELKRAARILSDGKKVAILAGRGALGAGEELAALADKLAAPVAKALLGRGVLPDDSPFTTGTLGLLGTKPSSDAMGQCDTLLIAGSSFPYIEYLPELGQARCVQIDLDPTRIGLRYPVDVGLVGDCKVLLKGLTEHARPAISRDFLLDIRKGVEEWQKLMDGRAERLDMPLKPQKLASELGRRLSDDAIVAVDSGTVTTWWARHIPVKGRQIHSVSGTLASMANSVSYAAAAQLAFPDRQCVALAGDGGFSMLMAEFATCVKYGLPVKVVVVKNNALGQIKWEQLGQLGNPEYGCDLHPIDFAAFARACGGSGYKIEDPADCDRMLNAALHSPEPVIVEAVVDPHEPPLPPKVTAEQAVNLGKALAKGTDDAGEIARTVLRNKTRELV